ncbi:hypothetical protein BKK79_31440 [Cupriavidus sp. USMAA2-4]|uniref:NADP-dependent oxidoreductase n=1 Tax=Cupriavidus sp. USMAA2-4 TaxID=876364 RepID=UPI0008A70B1E|nr:hypothetical protein BKK79_31440 [Cupriavidus sp. USMAA2-4]
MMRNREWRLERRPEGAVSSTDLVLHDSQIGMPDRGQFLVRVTTVSIDPAMRGWMSPLRSYIPPVALGQPMRAISAGVVIASRHAEFPEGTRVTGLFGLREHALSDGLMEGVGVRRIPDDIPDEVALGTCGLAGMTAYFGLFDVGRPAPGDTLVVSAAAGSVGSAVVQLGRLAGCHVIGVASSRRREAVLGDGAHEVVDYTGGDVDQRLKALCRQGIDIYFDNVGGAVLDAALKRINTGGRVVLCGGISQYNARKPVGPANYLALIGQRATMRGFVYFDYESQFAMAEQRLWDWHRSGALRQRVDIVDGIEHALQAIARVFEGSNTGKQLLRLHGATGGES